MMYVGSLCLSFLRRTNWINCHANRPITIALKIILRSKFFGLYSRMLDSELIQKWISLGHFMVLKCKTLINNGKIVSNYVIDNGNLFKFAGDSMNRICTIPLFSISQKGYRCIAFNLFSSTFESLAPLYLWTIIVYVASNIQLLIVFGRQQQTSDLTPR